jgi:hypothetical protein
MNPLRLALLTLAFLIGLNIAERLFHGAFTTQTRIALFGFFLSAAWCGSKD